MANNDISFEILKDFGAFGDGTWQKHLTLIKWGDNEPKFDLRTWNEDMTKCGKGITLTDADLYDLLGLIEDALGVADEDEADDVDDDEYEDEDDYEDEEEY